MSGREKYIGIGRGRWRSGEGGGGEGEEMKEEEEEEEEGRGRGRGRGGRLFCEWVVGCECVGVYMSVCGMCVCGRVGGGCKERGKEGRSMTYT